MSQNPQNANHLRAFTHLKEHGHPMCDRLGQGDMWDERTFMQMAKEGTACRTCQVMLENEHLKRRIQRAMDTYRPEFHLCDNTFAAINSILMKEEYQVYTSVVMAKQKMNALQLCGAMEHLLIDSDKSFCRNEPVIQEAIEEYRLYKEDLRTFEAIFESQEP